MLICTLRNRSRLVHSFVLLLVAVGLHIEAPAVDLLMHPDLPPGILYPSGAGDPHPAQIVPIVGNPAGAYAGSDYYVVQTGSVLNTGTAYGGIYFEMPTAFINMPIPQRFKFEYSLKGTSSTPFQLYWNNQDGLGEINRLSHVATVTSSWQRSAHYATLDGMPYGGVPNIPRHLMFLHSNDLWGGPRVRFLVDAITLAPVITGDFDEDSDHDCADVDALVAAIAAGVSTSLFDLTDDGTVDIADLHAWRAAAGEALFGPGRTILEGDANLDGFVDGTDFNTWNAHKFLSVAAWCSGDFSADGFVDGSDFNLWNSHKFTSSGSATAVPEPMAAALLLSGCAFLAVNHLRNRI
jgi:hypothetical protein